MKKYIIFLIIVFFTLPAFAAQEVFVLHNNGEIVGAGRVNKSRDNANRDGSTVLEFIERKVAEGDKVIYLPNRKLPNPDTQKVSGGKVVDMTPQEIAERKAAEPKSRIEQLEDRVTTLENAQ